MDFLKRLFKRLFGPPDVIAIEKKRDLAELTNLLKHRNKEIQVEAADAIMRLAGVRGLIRAFGHYDNAVRINAMEAILKVGEPAIEELKSAFINKQWINGMITFDLVDTYGSLAYPVEKSIKGYSAIALGKLGEKSAVNDLLGALGDDNKLVQVGVRYALAVLAEPSMIEPFLNEQNPIIKQAAEDILERIKKKCN